MVGPLSVPLIKTAYAGQITALCFVTPTVLLAATGPFLKVFDILAGKIIAVFEIFEHNRIHGIHPDRPPSSASGTLQTIRVALSGGKELKVLRLNFECDTITGTLVSCEQVIECPLRSFKDWIKDVHWMSADGDHPSITLALALTHNFVEVWDLTAGSLIDTVQCEEHCILYSARFFETGDGKTYLASGTVFNHVLLWDISARNQDGEGIIHKSLIGHEGVIFNIRVSRDGKRLATASDDRTIRVWETDIERKSQHICLYGHAARIWDCKLMGNYVVSVAEDSTCRVWDLETEECIACWEGHEGKNVWGVDIDPLANVVASGGGDSGIRLWSLTLLERNKIDSDAQMHQVQLPAASEESTAPEMVKTFGLLDFSQALISTTAGRFLTSHRDETLPMQEIYADRDLARYASLGTSECGQLSVVGGMEGQLAAFSPTGAFAATRWVGHVGKVTQVVIRSSGTAGIWYLFTADKNDEEMYMSCIKIPSEFGPCMVDRIATITLPEHFWTMDIAFSPEHQLLIMGSRSGAIVAYDTPLFEAKEGIVTEPTILLPALVRRRVHGKDSVSSIAIDDRPSIQSIGELIFGTVGRDGTYCRFAMAKQNETWTMELLYRSKITKGWLEKIYYVEDMAVLCGFYQKRFFAYNETKKYEMFSVACGGGHRKWDFRLQDGLLNRATFGFVRKEYLQLIFRETDNTQQFCEPKLQDNHSGNETRVVRFIDSWGENGDTSLLVTSGEDAVLRFAEYDSRRNDQSITNLLSVRKHTSVVRSIAFSKGLSGTLMFTAGAREEMRCWRLERDGDSAIRCLDMAVAPNASDITETRIMDIGSASLSALGKDFHGRHVVLAACSDAYLRLWLYDEASNEFSLVAYSRAHQRCVLKARISAFAEGLSTPAVVGITAGTDGRVMAWDFTDTVKQHFTESGSSVVDLAQPLYTSKVHQSGVNALDILPCPDSDKGLTLLIATGGDDNGISATKITFCDHISTQAGLTVQKVVQGIILSPHSSGVTGITVISASRFLTTSYDQRINAFDLAELSGDTYSFICVASQYVDVADISDMDVRLVR
ncbi:hypothetical protein PhCBS80983_g05566 [Powellomyces hirtus]|uniref:Uncharacterized protein n=1 Tax=Powellomyces hirtus TaxID=109895 RepID=A0A507DUB1_9FUNG|nr:hypothetical protein PhCBS80983_g05566 [Powellomyces hirtus]